MRMLWLGWLGGWKKAKGWGNFSTNKLKYFFDIGKKQEGEEILVLINWNIFFILEKSKRVGMNLNCSLSDCCDTGQKYIFFFYKFCNFH